MTQMEIIFMDNTKKEITMEKVYQPNYSTIYWFPLLGEMKYSNGGSYTGNYRFGLKHGFGI